MEIFRRRKCREYVICICYRKVFRFMVELSAGRLGGAVDAVLRAELLRRATQAVQPAHRSSAHLTIEILSIDSRLCLAEDDHPLLRHGLLSREEGEEKEEREKQQQEEKEEKHRESPLRASHPGTSTPRTRHATNHTHVDKPRVTHASHTTTRSFYLILRTKLYFFHSCVQRCHVSTTVFSRPTSPRFDVEGIYGRVAQSVGNRARFSNERSIQTIFISPPISLPLLFFFYAIFFLTKEPPLSTRFRNFCSRER